MDELMVIFGFVMVVLFAFVLPLSIYSIRTAHQKSMAELVADDRHIEAQALEEELLEVKERVAVLERIVTDGQYDLKQEIQRLESV
ncbi:MAG: hypothetical protein O7F71_20860 [Gammaproteobacteria bacterium]|nr:hypothetical protein [Gammaproteobacteria bacterium]